ncbi:hypothetical protein Tco_0782675 [Tanacetum coccineum]
MSDSDESGITHTEVSSPFEDLSDIGSPRADDHEFLEPEVLYCRWLLFRHTSPIYRSTVGPAVCRGCLSPIALSPDICAESAHEEIHEEDGDEDLSVDEEDEDDEMDIEIV